MAKANASLLPVRARRIDEIPVNLPGQQPVVIHLRVPHHAEMLKIVEERNIEAEKWCKPGASWFPCAEPFPVTRSILGVALLFFNQQSTPEGGVPPKEDLYSLPELIELCGRSVEFFDIGLLRFDEYASAVDQPVGNSSEGGVRVASSPPSETANPTPM